MSNIDLKATEDNILEILKSLCEEYNFQRYAHPGSLKTLGFPINKVTALLRYVNQKGNMPDNLHAKCVSQNVDVRFQIHVIYIDYRGHHKIYELAEKINCLLRGRNDLLVFNDGKKNTSYYSYVDGPEFLEVDNQDHACFSYSSDILLRYAESYKVKI